MMLLSLAFPYRAQVSPITRRTREKKPRFFSRRGASGRWDLFTHHFSR
jgi:hypothetical protein